MPIEKMRRVVEYYLGDYSDRMPVDALAELSEKLNSYSYTYWCFWAFVVSRWEPRKIIYRNFILSQMVWDDFRDFRDKELPRVKVQCALALDKIKAETHIFPPDEVLGDAGFRTPPLIRYIVGSELGLDMEAYRSSAIQQLREEPFLFEVLETFKELFPISEEEVMDNE